MLTALVVAGASAALPAGAFGGAHAASGRSVGLSGKRFRPSTIEIRRGETVTWSWHIPNSEHNVTFHGLHSRTGSRGTFTVRFSRAGTFAYVCTVHVAEGMRGKVIVR